MPNIRQAALAGALGLGATALTPEDAEAIQFPQYAKRMAAELMHRGTAPGTQISRQELKSLFKEIAPNKDPRWLGERLKILQDKGELERVGKNQYSYKVGQLTQELTNRQLELLNRMPSDRTLPFQVMAHLRKRGFKPGDKITEKQIISIYDEMGRYYSPTSERVFSDFLATGDLQPKGRYEGVLQEGPVWRFTEGRSPRPSRTLEVRADAPEELTERFTGALRQDLNRHRVANSWRPIDQPIRVTSFLSDLPKIPGKYRKAVLTKAIQRVEQEGITFIGDINTITSGRYLRAPLQHLPFRIDPDPRVLAEQEAKKVREYSEKALATEPLQDVFSRLSHTAGEEGLSYKDIRQKEPSLLSRYTQQLASLFKGQEILPASTFKAAGEKVASQGKYRITVERNKPVQTGLQAGEYTTTTLPRQFYQVLLHPNEMKDITKSVGKIQTHGVPMTHKDIPTIGWLKVVDDVPNNTWYIEEIQSDILAKLPKEKAESLAIEKQYTDWADYGLATVLKDAREQGVSSVRIIGKEEVQKLWQGLLGEKKSNIYYKDLPKRFGFRLDTEDYTPSNRFPKEELTNLKTSSRIPSIILTALGTGAAMETLNSDEAQASPLGKKFVQVGSEVLLPASSTAKDLVGTELWGKVVKAVTKGKGKERFIIFTDGTARKADSQYLNDLMRVRGDVRYLDRLKRKGQKGKVRQVEKSMNLRVSASDNFNLRPATGSATSPNFERGHQQRVKELGITPTQKVGAWKGKTYITLPKEYAEILQRQGLIRIDKEIK